MRKSIKWKLTISFIIVIVCCIGSILLFNSLFLEKLYISEKKSIIKSSYYALNRGIMESYEAGYSLSDLFKKTKNSDSDSTESSLARFLRELQENYNVQAVLMDENNKTYSIFQNNNRFGKRIFQYIFKNNSEDTNLEILEKNEHYTIAINTPPKNSVVPHPVGVVEGGPTDYYENKGPGDIDTNPNNQKRPQGFFAPMNRDSDIECFGFLDDDATAFFLTIPVGSIKEPIALFNKVLIILSILITIIGSIIIFIISNNMVKPLQRLTEISKKMGRLEFQNKYEEKREDEIGILGNTMNELSSKLEKAIKELKNANINLKKDLEQKEQLDLMRQEFVANVSHELKTPIALIEGYAEGLETEGIADNKESRDYYISVIKDETEKMNLMVRQLLDLSAIERGADNIEVSRISLNEAVSGLLKSQEINIKEKGAKVVVNIAPDSYVWADGYKLEEVLRNYFTNAIHYVDENKLIKIYTENISKDKLRFIVYNSGIQLPDEELEKIWEKFYKVDKARTREYGGTGLGLSIVKAIAKQHSTDCGCENVILDGLKGMAFYFDFVIK